MALNLPAKKIRAQVICEYVIDAGYKGVVAFSCGNATRALKETGLFVLDISPCGDLSPSEKWWSPAEIQRMFPYLFDATSGHLPVHLMIRIAISFREHLGEIKGCDVPTGSGETITCLRWAYPNEKFSPVYNLDQATKYEQNAPLNYLVLQGAD